MNFILLLHLSVILTICNGFGFKSKLKQIKELASKYRKKGNNWIVLDDNLDDFPGNDNEKRLRQKIIWEEYYECLHKQANHMKINNTRMPKALLALEGTTVSMACSLCLPPDRQHERELVTWWKTPLTNGKSEQVEEDEKCVIGINDKTLTIYSIELGHSGRYQCELGSTPTIPYFLSVISEDVPVMMVNPLTARTGPYEPDPVSITLLDGSEIVVTTAWSPWESCSRCGKVGRRKRIGACHVRLQKIGPGIQKDAIPHDAIGEMIIKKLNLWSTSVDLLQLFPDGIPCLSQILPIPIRQLSEIQSRKTLVMIGYCKVKCATPLIFEVRDQQGNIIEIANNSAGVYSTLQDLPEAPPPVVRVTIYEDIGKRFSMKCPGNLKTDSPIKWKIGSKILNAKTIKEQSNGRIQINANDHIILKDTRIADTHLYSCWQDDELAGTIRLIIKKKFQLGNDKHVVLLGTALISCTFMYVYCKAYKGRKRKLYNLS